MAEPPERTLLQRVLSAIRDNPPYPKEPRQWHPWYLDSDTYTAAGRFVGPVFRRWDGARWEYRRDVEGEQKEEYWDEQGRHIW